MIFGATQILVSLGLACTAALGSEAVIEAAGSLPADWRDQSGDTIGGIGSGMVYDQDTDTYLCISDRGPGDGTLPYRPRYVMLKIAQNGDRLEPSLVRSVILMDENGQAMTGLIPDDPKAATPRMKDGRTCIDPEAIALAPDKTLYITDEYGPYLYQFHADGRMIRRLALPEQFAPKTSDGSLDFSAEARLASGRNINQGPEGMCLLPGGRTAALIFQSGTVQAGGKKSPGTKFILIDLATGNLVSEYDYPFSARIPGSDRPLKNGDLSVNDLAPLDDRRLLVLERDGSGRNGSKTFPPAAYKSVWMVEMTPQGLEKTFLFNLPALVKEPRDLSAKWEGLALLPSDRAGEATLMMTADNDFLSPLVHEAGESYPFPRAEDAVPTQFFKIRVRLPEKP